jgi:CheY-like chemotaxis protein
MWVESEPGRGSAFFFTAVMKASLEDQPPAPALLKPHCVLIVDDNATNRGILEAQLKIWGMTPTSASSGQEALEILAERNFDVVLIDLQMPEMDGITLAREIHEQIQTPLILLSSSGEIAVGEEASLFQFQIPKPIRHSDLFNALLKITGVEPEHPQTVPQKRFDSSMAAKHPLRILLAEDNVVNQKVCLMMLSRLGYGPDLTVNGRRAVDAIEKAEYDLILMDIQMPEMDGIEAAHIVREKLGTKCPAIFALTAEALKGDQERFLSLGFDGYLSKPVQANALQDILKVVKSRA